MVTSIKKDTIKEALAKAKAEVKDEEQKKMVKVFKDKLKQVQSARTILRNLERELSELEYELEKL